jgi:phospholipid/cholesterol/gamma-HCH transport system substrate-binding protein
VDTLTTGHADSLKVLLENLNSSARRMDQTLESFDLMASDLSELMRKVNQGEGTLGLLVNDPAVYLRMDSTLMSMNALLRRSGSIHQGDENNRPVLISRTPLF